MNSICKLLRWKFRLEMGHCLIKCLFVQEEISSLPFIIFPINSPACQIRNRCIIPQENNIDFYAVCVLREMSKCPGLYFDIGKRAKDVLHKDYPNQPPIHFHYQIMDWNLDLSCQVDEIVPGLRSLCNFTLPDSGKVELQHLSNYTGITGCIGLIGNLERGYDPVANFSGLIGTDILSLGAKLAIDISTREFRKMNVGFSLNTPFLVASMTMHDRFDTVKASFYHEVNPLTKTALAAEVKHRISMNETGVTIGAQLALLPCTMVKAKLDTYGKAGGLLQQQFWQRICISMAGEIDFRAESKLPKFGLSLGLAP